MLHVSRLLCKERAKNDVNILFLCVIPLAKIVSATKKMASTSNSESPSVSDLEKSRSGLCEEFATITGTDSAVAQCYLAENDWEMEVQ